MSSRRHFLRTGLAAAFVPGSGLRAQAQRLPVRAITRGPQFHWFAYYDKLQFCPQNRLVLGNQVGFEHRSPQPDDGIRVGLVDLEDGDRWTELGTSRAWNWQQGCMLQWLPGSADTVLWNDREGDQFVCHLVEVKSGRKSTLPNPVYAVSPDGTWGVSPDFRRLNDTRPGYGYAGIADPNREVLAPDDAGIWKVDLASGRQELILTLAQVVAIPHEGGFSPNAKHWFNHLLVSPDGRRFIFLHRWKGDGDKTFHTRLFTADKDGRDLYVLDPLGRTSHFVWRDPQHVFAWAFHPSHGERFDLFKDKTREVAVVGREKMDRNGHNTYLPGTDNAWVLNDSYPDKQRMQTPYLYHIPTDRRVDLGHFYSPAFYTGEWRCDTHPRSSRDGRLVCIDSPHQGGRQMYLIDVRDIVG